MHTKLHSPTGRRNTDLPLIVLALSACMQILLWAILNLRYPYIFDYDAAKLFYHVICMWREKTLLIPDWVYMTTGEWDCASLPALLFYGLTGNIKLAFGLANVCNILLFALVISRLFRAVPAEHGRQKGMLLGICLVLMPYYWDMLDYANMLFYGGAQYIYKVLLPVWLISLYVGMPQKRLPAALYTAAFLLLVFATASSSGLYVMICGLFPILCCRLVRALGTENAQPDRRGLLISALTAAVFLAGFAFQKAVHLSTKTDEMTLIPMTELMPRIAQVVRDFFGVTMVLHPHEPVPLFSFTAILCCCKIAVVVVMCLTGMRELSHCFMLKTCFSEPERIRDDERFARAALASVFVFNLLILLLSESSARYHLIGYIPLMLLSCMALAQRLEACPSSRLRRVLWLAVSAVVILLAAMLFFNARTSVNGNQELRCQPVIEEAERQDVQTVVVLDDGWLTENTRPLDPDRTYVTYFSSSQELINYDVPASFNDMRLLSGRHMLVAQDA
ncbi:MAG: hypothetical protein ACI4O4_04340, partial [Candidatus Ventricola sp.]